MSDNEETSPPVPVTDEQLKDHIVSIHHRLNRLNEKVDTMGEDVSAMKIALIGNQYNPNGALTRLDAVETKCEMHDRKLLVWGSVATSAGVLLSYLKDFLHK